MNDTILTIDDKTFDHLRITSFNQTFEVLDGKNSTRTLDGNMNRDIIGVYYNYKLGIKPDCTPEGMKEYNLLWGMCSDTQEAHTITLPFDVDLTKEGETQKTMITQKMYITQGSRNMLKYNVGHTATTEGIDYWGDGEFTFIAMQPKLKK